MIEVHIGEAASYAASGVDIDAGDAVSRLWHEASRQTFENRPDRLGLLALLGEGAFGIRGFDLDVIQGQMGLVLVGGVDGVGTKPELPERLKSLRQYKKIKVKEEFRDHSGIFHDLVAMVADDIARDGGEPFGVATIFDANTLSEKRAEEVVRELCIGAVAACNSAEIVYFNGETAELGNRVGGHGPFNYNLAGFALGAIHKKRVLTGEKVAPGQAIVALREHGFRANGMSLVRKVMKAKFGRNWHFEGRRDFVADAMKPSIIYTPLFVDLHGGYDLDRDPRDENVSALIHVTGGGIPGKLQRKLAVSGHGAVLDNLFEMPPAMRQLQEWSLEVGGKLATPDESLLQSLNGGTGGLGITSDPDKFMSIAAKHGIESQVAGEVVEDPGIEMKSNGLTSPGEWIKFIPRAA